LLVIVRRGFKLLNVYFKNLCNYDTIVTLANKEGVHIMKKKCKKLEIFLFILLVLQLLVIAVFNLTRLPYVAGFDSSAAMAQAMQIWKQRTIFLKDWAYQSTLGLDSGLLLASMIYGVTGNIFISYGLSNCVIIALYFYVIYEILKEINVSKTVRLITLIILFTPYSLEPLGYMPMLFTNASYYSIKVLIHKIHILNNSNYMHLKQLIDYYKYQTIYMSH
jgi:hypothetical protein